MRNDKKAVIFDFDGTMATTEVATMEALNVLATKYGYALLSPADMEDYKRIGAKRFYKRLRVPFWKLLAFSREAREEYGKKIWELELHQGILDVTRGLKTNNYILGVITSNMSGRVGDFLLSNEIVQMDFISAGGGFFGKAKMLSKLLREYNLESGNVVYVGDETRDVEAALKAGVLFVGVSWGLGTKDSLEQTGALCVVDKPSELLSCLLNI